MSRLDPRSGQERRRAPSLRPLGLLSAAVAAAGLLTLAPTLARERTGGSANGTALQQEATATPPPGDTPTPLPPGDTPTPPPPGDTPTPPPPGDTPTPPPPGDTPTPTGDQPDTPGIPTLPAETPTSSASTTPGDATPSPATSTPEGTRPTATPPPDFTSTAVPSPAPRPAAIFAPYAAKSWTLPLAKPRTWGLQIAWDEVPSEYADGLRELPRARQAGISAIRTDLRWSLVEPQNTSPDKFNWEDSDKRVKDYSAANLDIILTVVDYPKWAMVYACGYAFQPGMEGEWASFITEAAKRYRQRPYRVVAFELGNEIDGATVITEADRQRPVGWGKNEPTLPVGGCWGDRAADYLKFLRPGYESIKAVDPDTLVTFGNLAYAWPLGGDIEFHVDFFDKLLDAGGGPYFDYLGYHWFPDLIGQPDGPAKLRRLLDSMRRRGITGRPIWLTETYGLTLPGDLASYRRQIEYLTKQYVEILAFPELARVYWFSWIDSPLAFKPSPGSPDRGIVTTSRDPKPALQVLPYTIRYTNGRPENASTADMAVYRFWPPRAGEHYVVAWSKDGARHTLTEAVWPGAAVKQTRFPYDDVLAFRCCRESTQVATGSSIAIEVTGDAVFVEVR